MDHRPLWAHGNSWTFEDTKGILWLAVAAGAAIFLVWSIFLR